ncbi:ABC transporter permease [Prosthecochloris sp. CIB 2401]|uniref:ABC transporter permease n=1 Tax=Prosthecochloris sp. CIB 2401 TaxID=1868325 RepID=UPI00080AB603|nr:ABC transporter permease [Prosthecochloris sp. CIB 2401]ANT65930.1 MacB-like periplasmic core domain protein [Prosthecochloris sp. CIB 2401]
MISLAGKDILHGWGRFVLTAAGLGLLIGVTLSMAGIYRGMVDDGNILLDNSGADLWVVQQGTIGPYAEPSTISDDLYRSVLGIEGVKAASNVIYLTMQVYHGERDIRAMVTGVAQGLPDDPGKPRFLVAGRQITAGHYEAVADMSSGLKVDDIVTIRRNRYRVVGLTRRMVSSSGDPMIFIPIKDAMDAQYLKDSDAIVQQRRRRSESPVFNPPGQPRVLDAINEADAASNAVNAVLVSLSPGYAAAEVGTSIEQWLRVATYSRSEMKSILVDKLISTSARQIAMFLVILAIVSAAIVAFIIYTMTMAKIREIAVLKLLGTRNSVIASMILQQSVGLGFLGFMVGRIATTFWAPFFPKYVLLEPGDALRGLVAVLVICMVASILAIRAALKIDPAEAIGG